MERVLSGQLQMSSVYSLPSMQCWEVTHHNTPCFHHHSRHPAAKESASTTQTIVNSVLRLHMDELKKIKILENLEDQLIYLEAPHLGLDYLGPLLV